MKVQGQTTKCPKLREKAMNKFFASIAGIALMGAIGATTAQAQSVHIKIEKPGKSIEIKHGQPAPKPADDCNDGHYITVKKKVWIEGHYDTVCENVWIPPTCKIVEERVWVPATCRIVEERVYVPAQHVTVKERRVDHCGHVYYVNVCQVVPAHYKTVQKEVHVPGFFKCVQREVHVPGRYEKVEKKVYVAGRYEIVEERVFVKHDHGHAKPKVEHKETISVPRGGRSTR